MLARYSISFALVLTALSGTANTLPPLDEYIRDGRLRDGLAAYASPANNNERFSLAVLQALDGLQQFSAGFNKLGINPELAQSGIPFLRVLVPNRQHPLNDVATPEKVARLFSNLKMSLKHANSTLAVMDEKPFSVEVNLSQAHMDIDGDGTVASNEFLVASLGRSLGLSSVNSGEDVVIRFDSADAMWLKGYTHLLQGVLDVLMAYDWMPVWNQCAHVVFSNPQPLPPIAQYTDPRRDRETIQIFELIAALHEMRLKLVHKDGLRDARDEFRAMISCSRVCWQRVLSETDNDHEWLPSPTQMGPRGARITAQQIAGWQHVLDELDAILSGKKLLAHWRIKEGTGINVDKLVKSPPPLDAVLLIQGSAFIPYLEEGSVSDRAAWQALIQPFGSGFAGFAIWSN